jgi:hypothetical protein
MSDRPFAEIDVEALAARIYAQRDQLPSQMRAPHNAFRREDAECIARAVLSSEWLATYVESVTPSERTDDRSFAENDAHDSRCFQRTGFPDDLPADVCDCKVWRTIDAATTAESDRTCSTPGCSGDGRYAPPGRGHVAGCTHLSLSAEKDVPDCRCPTPKPNGRGECSACGRFACEYADRGRTRCSPSICDCFIDTYPDSPRALHPEAFIVTGIRVTPPKGPPMSGNDVTGPCPSCGAVATRSMYDIGSGPELACASCEWCWGAMGQDLKPLPRVIPPGEGQS